MSWSYQIEYYSLQFKGILIFLGSNIYYRNENNCSSINFVIPSCLIDGLKGRSMYQTNFLEALQFEGRKKIALQLTILT